MEVYKLTSGSQKPQKNQKNKIDCLKYKYLQPTNDTVQVNSISDIIPNKDKCYSLQSRKNNVKEICQIDF